MIAPKPGRRNNRESANQETRKDSEDFIGEDGDFYGGNATAKVVEETRTRVNTLMTLDNEVAQERTVDNMMTAITAE
ncbi:hypothetical protein OIU74_015867 [Salix koriyanagi]|uniref:Uncharacterized protein n=1 Tax=Salix koriyanagi TaxID=2511006 RepID=A0A9Q0PN25_9ROSI|nr:hypothetical protein OIU74_015867 [Salix koriyanagi]